MQLSVKNAITSQSRCNQSRGGDFKQIAGDEWSHSGRQNGLRTGVSEEVEPKRTASQDNATANGGAERSTGDTATNPAPEYRRNRGGQRVRQQIAAGGSEQMGQPAQRRHWSEDRQAERTFSQISNHGSGSQAGRQEEPNQQNGEGLQGERNGREVERQGNVGAN